MAQGRADHAVHYFKDNIYVFGGMSGRSEQDGGYPFVKSLNSAEVYNIKSGQWSTLESFNQARQALSVCQFNDKFIFILGGKRMKPEAKTVAVE